MLPTDGTFHDSPPRPKKRLEPAVKSTAVANCWKFAMHPGIDPPEL